MLIHGFPPKGFLKSQIIPIPKNKRKSLNDMSNYRGIAMSSVLGKVLDSVIISRRALAPEGDYEMMPVCACVRACVCALVSHADFSKTTTATDFL